MMEREVTPSIGERGNDERQLGEIQLFSKKNFVEVITSNILIQFSNWFETSETHFSTAAS